MYQYDTVSEALTDLKKRGYSYDFNLRSNNFYCAVLDREYNAPQLQVKETYRFEGDSDPEDEAIIFAIAAEDGVQGTFVNGYGTYADSESEALLHLQKQAAL
jgi:hypothetical protein